MKFRSIFFSVVGLLGLSLPVQAQTDLDSQIQQVLNQHYQTYRDREYFSAIQSSIQIGDQPVRTYVVGQTSRDAKGEPINSQTLFNLGSITKSFTAALALQAEKAGKVDLEADFTEYLPEYKKWSGISLTRLLNMTSGLPNYSDTATVNYLMAQDLTRFWTESELISTVYPQNVDPAPPLKSGYFYSNTAYILSGMILEKQYQQPLKTLLENYIFKSHSLHNTFYPVPDYPEAVKQRLVHGYNYNNYDSPELTGQDVTTNNLSWAGAAGAIVANSEDLVKWIRLLFVENELLDAKQKAKLQQIASIKTGKAIAETTAEDNRGFGLGVVQGYDSGLGRYWFYEGETLGYRAVYFYLPCQKMIVTTLVNSSVADSNDHAGQLTKEIYQVMAKANPQNSCQQK